MVCDMPNEKKINPKRLPLTQNRTEHHLWDRWNETGVRTVEV